MATSQHPTAQPPSQSGKSGFWSLFVTQFQGAFSDNAFKFLMIFMITNMLTEQQAMQLVPVVGILFALPFILFSMAGGFLADRYCKRTVAIGTKVAEIATMSLALAGFLADSIPILLVCVFLMSAQSAFFSPTKFGLLPELLPEKDLSWGNGTLSLGTFMAIIAGTAAAGILSDMLGERQIWSGVVLVALAVMGMVVSFGITAVPAANAEKTFRLNFVADLLVNLRAVRENRVLTLAIIGNTYFWFLAALIQPNVVLYGRFVLGLSDTQSSALQAALAIGIGVGSFIAGVLSDRKIEYGLIPLGSIGMTVVAALLGVPGASFICVAALLWLFGFFVGFYIVPISALIQHCPEPGDKGSVIAAASFLSWVGVLAASSVYYLLATFLDLSPLQIFLCISSATIVGTVTSLKLVPDSMLRLLFWLITRTVYKISIIGRDNIPDRGGALFVCNHLSFVDGFLLVASTDRHVHFLMDQNVYEKRWINPFARIMQAIPISSDQGPREMIRSLRKASDWIRNGDVVCIFAEGQISRIGQMLPFRRGFERIMKDVDAPIIPVALDGVWGSIFSFERGRFIWKIPRKVPYPVTVSYGPPMPSTSTAFEIRQEVQRLLADSWSIRKSRMKTLHRAFRDSARRYPFRLCMADAKTPPITFSTALTKVVFVARRLKPVWAGQSMVGILLPPSVPGAVVNYAALFMGKVPVNLNYTVSEQSLASALKQCEITTVLTSQLFLDAIKIPLPDDIDMILLENVVENPSVTEKSIAALMSWLLPGRFLESRLGEGAATDLDDLATVIFSSGSTGEPKGVMTSHYNIASNIEQLGQTFALDRDDCFLGVLPFFHSFGFTGTLMLPGVLGAGVVFHANPLDARTIGGLVERFKITFLLATPTFLQIYMRGCEAGQFGSVAFAAVGAEKCPERLATAFEDKFGIRPMEAYGCTECSPAVAINTRDFRAAGFRQVGGKRGKIGHPLPGMTIRILDPETMAPIPLGDQGMMVVRGPNVMQGYLKQSEKTAAVLRDGWYTTGDIAKIDDDGFLEITDRLSRFSKIGGEMVPHIKIEELLHEYADATEQVFIVTAVPDAKKGEKLVVLYTAKVGDIAAVTEKLSGNDIPNLWKPRADHFFQIDALPILGTGKVDLRKVREIAVEKVTV